MAGSRSRKQKREQGPDTAADGGAGQAHNSMDPPNKRSYLPTESQEDGYGYSSSMDPLDVPSARSTGHEGQQHWGGHGEGDRKGRPTAHSPSRSLSGLRTSHSLASREALLGPSRPRPHKIWKKKFIKVLVVGDSGLGKTTLIKTLLSTPGERLQVHDGTTTPTPQFVKDPESLCSSVTWKDEEDRVIWVYRIQDTPGYGDDLDIMNHIRMMLAFLNKCNNQWLALEQAANRSMDLSEVEDPRVDICLFCVPPHRLRPIDLRYMFELGRAVPIIPVITKADTMTIREAQTYKQEVFNKLQNPNLRGVHGKINVFNFEKDTLERAGIAEASTSNTPPFMVIASNDINEEMGGLDVPVFWPERRYPWGCAEAFNTEHSDLMHLRALLLKEALEEVCKDKRARYEAWRRRMLGGWKLGRKLRKFLLWTAVPVAATVYFAHHGFNPERVQASLRRTTQKLPGLRRRKQQQMQVQEGAPVLMPVAPSHTGERRWF